MAFVQKSSDQISAQEPADAPPAASSASAFADPTAFWALVAAATLLFSLGLGGIDLWAPDEPRYGAIAEELRSGRHGPEGLVLLHLNDEPYTQKPPLYFWLAALAGSLPGRVSEIPARLPSALAGVLCVALTARVARRLGHSPRAALLAAAFLATSFRFVFTARRAQLDVLLTAFELIAIALFVAVEFRGLRGMSTAQAITPATAPAPSTGPSKAPSKAQVAGIHAALGAAALVKGPVGWLPLLIIAAYLAWQGRIRSFRHYAPAWSYLLSFGPLLLWISVAVALAPPGFAEVAVGENVFGRFFSGTSHVRPFYYFLYQLPVDALPWSLLLPWGLAHLWGEAREKTNSSARFLICWIAVPFLFFTLSAGKRGVYLLPVFPALAVVCVLALRPRSGSGESAEVWLRRGAFAVGAVALIELAGFTLGQRMLDPEKSPRPIAIATAAASRPGERVGVYGLRPIEGGLSYYGGVRIESLRDQPNLEKFLAGSGRLVLMRARHFEALSNDWDLRKVGSFRTGRRQLILAERVSQTP